MARMPMLFIMLLLQVALLASCAAKRTSVADESIFDSTNGTNLCGIMLAVVAVFAGSGMVVVGYRFMYETVFTIGFALGAIGIAVTTERMLVDKSFWRAGSWVAFVVGGAICGGMAIWVHPKSNFIAGVAGGMTLAMIVTNSAGYYVLPGHTHELFTILCVVLTVVFAAFELKYGKPMDIVGISTFGAAILVWGVSFFVGDFPFLNNLDKYSTHTADDDLVYTIRWGYLAGIMMISVFGIVIQFHMTGCSAIDDEFASFGTSGFGLSMDAVSYVGNEKEHPNVSITDQSANNTARESDFMPSSYSSILHQSFCRLYSRNTEAESSNKIKSTFMKKRSESVETTNALDSRVSLQSPRMNYLQGASKEVEF
ncbi:hypothetical protein KXD40_006406 [Peronospora effusa]|uniref:Transmembrane protein 198 n=1 Tax=Peronospora effusa TaxID=542832 RepID=A0A3M6VH57_9STRA|nr:hypothetical protein DD238_001694 [Peronospora effusa]UIZ25830.1 hypothetical protein KXD40_006406 [Peronospora effusa]CAI5706436.1 unnamed protein product [Peronospora effusa]